MYIDSHVHYDMKIFNKDRTALLAALQANHIEAVINAATRYESNFTMQEKMDAYDWVHYAVGIHPNHVGIMDEVDEVWEKGLLRLLTDGNKIVAIGETGLDVHRLKRNERGELEEESERKLKRQYQWFRKQVEMAIHKKLPLILHVRDAHEEAITVLKEYAEQLPLRNAGVIHCYNGDLETAWRYADMGFSFGIGGLVTEEENQRLRTAVAGLPLSRILLETDAPYVTPAGALEKRNSSLNLPMIAEEVAKLKGVSVDEVERSTTDNAKKLFGI